MKKINFVLTLILSVFCANTAFCNPQVFVRGSSYNTSVVNINSATRVNTFTSSPGILISPVVSNFTLNRSYSQGTIWNRPGSYNSINNQVLNIQNQTRIRSGIIIP